MTDINTIIDQFIRDSNSTNPHDAAERGRRIKSNFEQILRKLGVVSTEVDETVSIIQTDGDGTQFLSNDGTYKTVVSASPTDNNLDGGFPDSVYLPSQKYDGGVVEWQT